MAQGAGVAIEILRKLARAGEALDEFRDAFEDFLIVHNPAILRRLRKARREQLAGKTRPVAEFIAEMNHAKRRVRSASRRGDRPT